MISIIKFLVKHEISTRKFGEFARIIELKKKDDSKDTVTISFSSMGPYERTVRFLLWCKEVFHEKWREIIVNALIEMVPEKKDEIDVLRHEPNISKTINLETYEEYRKLVESKDASSKEFIIRLNSKDEIISFLSVSKLVKLFTGDKKLDKIEWIFRKSQQIEYFILLEYFIKKQKKMNTEQVFKNEYIQEKSIIKSEDGLKRYISNSANINKFKKYLSKYLTEIINNGNKPSQKILVRTIRIGVGQISYVNEKLILCR